MTKKTAKAKPFDAETLDELLKKISVFHKLDFAYFTAALAIITALNITKHELIDWLAEGRFAFLALILVLFFDTLLLSFISSNWLELKRKKQPSISDNILEVMAGLQPFIHFIFVIFILVGFVGYSSGVVDYKKEFTKYVKAQDLVELYIQTFGNSPETMEDTSKLFGVYDFADELFDSFKDTKFKYEKKGPKGYLLTFAAEDGRFNTSDDQWVDENFDLSDIIKNNPNNACFSDQN